MRLQYFCVQACLYSRGDILQGRIARLSAEAKLQLPPHNRGKVSFACFGRPAQMRTPSWVLHGDMLWQTQTTATNVTYVCMQARTDELRIQKRFLNDMFARVKQEYLQRRLRQQQIEQMLGHKAGLAALPSTAAEGAGPSHTLALRNSSDSTPLLQQPELSPGQSYLCFYRHVGMHTNLSLSRCCSVVTGRAANRHMRH